MKSILTRKFFHLKYLLSKIIFIFSMENKNKA